MEKEITTKPEKKLSNSHRSKKISIVALVIILILILGTSLFPQAKRKALPQENTFYAAYYHGMPILFYKYEGMMNYPGNPIGSSMGMYVTYDKAMNPMMMNAMMNVEYVDFQKLQNPQKLFIFDRYATLENIQLSDDKNYLAMSFIGGQNDSTNYIYQINLSTHEGKKIWEHEQRTGKAPYNSGFAYITQFIPNRFVVFEFIKGDPPPSELPAGVVIKNIQTGSEKVLGIVGDIQINLDNNTVSYKLLEKTQVPCEGKSDPVCFAGDIHKNAYEPKGSILTQPLP